MNLFKRLKCFLGLHEPMKYVTVRYNGKDFKMCKNCGKLLEPPESEET